MWLPNSETAKSRIKAFGPQQRSVLKHSITLTTKLKTIIFADCHYHPYLVALQKTHLLIAAIQVAISLRGA